MTHLRLVKNDDDLPAALTGILISPRRAASWGDIRDDLVAYGLPMLVSKYQTDKEAVVFMCGRILAYLDFGDERFEPRATEAKQLVERLGLVGFKADT